MPQSFVSRLGKAASAFGRVVRGLPLPDHIMYDFYGQPAGFKPKESLDAYGNNVWLYSAVNKISQEIARTKFRLRIRKKNGEFEYIEKHEALDTLNRPQPMVKDGKLVNGGKSSLTGFQLQYVMGMHLGLNGEAFWALQDRLKINGSPKRIDPLIPANIYVKNDPKTGELVKYVYRIPDREVEIDPMNMVHFKIPSPLNWNRGHSPTESIKYAIDTYNEAEKMNFKRLKNNGVPGGILKTDATNLDEGTIGRLRAMWNQLYSGTENSGKTAILTKGMDFQATQLTNTDMQFMEGKDRNRDEILANYGVSLEVLGQTDSVTRANAEASIFVFMRFGTLPYLESIQDTLNNDFLPAFPGTEGMEFCFDDPVPANMEEKRANAAVLMDNGGMTPDEMRKLFGYEPLGIPGVTDIPYMGFSRVPLGQSPPEPAPLG